jgi:hypothetical protein
MKTPDRRNGKLRDSTGAVVAIKHALLLMCTVDALRAYEGLQFVLVFRSFGIQEPDDVCSRIAELGRNIEFSRVSAAIDAFMPTANAWVACCP